MSETHKEGWAFSKKKKKYLILYDNKATIEKWLNGLLELS